MIVQGFNNLPDILRYLKHRLCGRFIKTPVQLVKSKAYDPWQIV